LAAYHNPRYDHSYHSNVAAYPVKAYQTYYPSSPSHHYTNQPTHHYCNIPPDLWCDSPQAAQQCGVQRQCDALRMHRRKPSRSHSSTKHCVPTARSSSLINWEACISSTRTTWSWNWCRGVTHVFFETVRSRVITGGKNVMRIVCNHVHLEPYLSSCASSGSSITTLSIKLCTPVQRLFEVNVYDGERGVQLQRAAAHKTMSTKPHPILE
ncbi:hypothetical protein OSTOST_10714, partial [Ostertagia ostertagi]